MFKFLHQKFYNPQTLSPKQKAVIVHLDQRLVELHPDPVTDELYPCLHALQIPLRSQLIGTPLVNIQDIIRGRAYIPRSVALVVEADGTWTLIYATRDEVGSDDLTLSMFFDILNRTNNAR